MMHHKDKSSSFHLLLPPKCLAFSYKNWHYLLHWMNCPNEQTMHPTKFARIPWMKYIGYPQIHSSKTFYFVSLLLLHPILLLLVSKSHTVVCATLNTFLDIVFVVMHQALILVNVATPFFDSHLFLIIVNFLLTFSCNSISLSLIFHEPCNIPMIKSVLLHHLIDAQSKEIVVASFVNVSYVAIIWTS